MLTRDLLVDAADACVSAGFGSPALVQRRVRVGFVTASQLLIALQDLGILDEHGERGRFKARRAKAGRLPLEIEIDAAIKQGLIELTPVSSPCQPGQAP